MVIDGAAVEGLRRGGARGGLGSVQGCRCRCCRCRQRQPRACRRAGAPGCAARCWCGAPTGWRSSPRACSGAPSTSTSPAPPTSRTRCPRVRHGRCGERRLPLAAVDELHRRCRPCCSVQAAAAQVLWERRAQAATAGCWQSLPCWMRAGTPHIRRPGARGQAAVAGAAGAGVGRRGGAGGTGGGPAVGGVSPR